MSTTFDQIFSGTRPQQPPTYSALYPAPSTSQASPPAHRRRSVNSQSRAPQNPFQDEKVMHSPSKQPHSHQLQTPDLPPRTSRSSRHRAVSSVDSSRYLSTTKSPHVSVAPVADRGFEKAGRETDPHSHYFTDRHGKRWQKTPGNSSEPLKAARSQKLAAPKPMGKRTRSPQPFVAWDGDDKSRLPEGFRRTGYDADMEVYYFKDREGRQWQSKPGNEYGRLMPVPKEPQGKEGMFAASPGIKRSRTVSNPNPRHTFENIIESGEKKSLWGRLRGMSVRE